MSDSESDSSSSSGDFGKEAGGIAAGITAFSVSILWHFPKIDLQGWLWG